MAEQLTLNGGFLRRKAHGKPVKIVGKLCPDFSFHSSRRVGGSNPRATFKQFCSEDIQSTTFCTCSLPSSLSGSGP